MKTKLILGFLVTIFLLISCSNQNDELLNTDTELIVESKSTISDSFETYHVQTDNWNDNNPNNDHDYIKISFENLSSDVNNKLTIESWYSDSMKIEREYSEGWILYNHTLQKKIILKVKNGKVGYKVTETVTEGEYINLNFPINSVEKTITTFEEWIIKENGIFK